MNPSELPQTHHLSHAMTLTPFCRCCYSVALTVIPTQIFESLVSRLFRDRVQLGSGPLVLALAHPGGLDRDAHPAARAGKLFAYIDFAVIDDHRFGNARRRSRTDTRRVQRLALDQDRSRNLPHGDDARLERLADTWNQRTAK
jgi:hypothetical protein